MVDYGDRLKAIFGLQSSHIGGEDFFQLTPTIFQSWMKALYQNDIQALRITLFQSCQQQHSRNTSCSTYDGSSIELFWT